MKSAILPVCGLTIGLLGGVSPVGAGSVDGAMLLSNGRIQMQADYALEAGEQVIEFLKTYRGAYNQAAPDEIVDWYTTALLQNGADPIIEVIIYLPEQRLAVKLYNNEFVETGLKGEEFIYQFQDGQWELDTDNYPTAAPDGSLVPPDFDFFATMNAISAYCRNPWGIKYPALEHSITDTDWCPAWHLFIWPPLPPMPPKDICAANP
ncbi:MAG: hypothetical protein GY862_26640 [Gammaproteobacteria bacterium]|nr:hypothetical protein [Gammaproteobacteria bacterium]